MYTYNVRENKLITNTVRLLTLTPNSPNDRLLYRPGQYAAISLHDKVRPTTTRCFSLTSSPTRGAELQFSIRVNGKYTSALERLRVGDTVAVRGPFGNFIFDEFEKKNLVFFAGGIGIAPFMGMLRYAVDIHATNNIHVVFSNRGYDDVPFLQELTELEQSHVNIQVTHVLSNNTKPHEPERNVIPGTIDATTIQKLGIFSDPNERYLVCGPPGYMAAVFRVLQEAGIKKQYIQSESFSQDSSNQTEKLTRWPAHTYALSGILFLVIGGSIVSAEVQNTLPKLEEDFSKTYIHTEEYFETLESNFMSKVRSVPPRIDTNTAQEPIYTYKENDEVIVITQPATQNTNSPTQPVKSPTPTPTPSVVRETTKTQPTQPAPAPVTTVAKDPPRTTVS